MFRSLLSLLRGSSGDDADETTFRRDIEDLEAKAQTASVDRRAQLYNQAGELCLKEGQYMRSLQFFGHAIDSYLESGHFDAAPALCRKVIRISPEVIRARSTLASIFLAKGMYDDAERHITDYVHAAEAAEQEELAVKRLRLMAAATESHSVRMLVGEYLMELGDSRAADQVFGSVFAERNGLRKPLPADEELRWERLLHIALMGPSDLVQEEATVGRN